MLQFFMVSILEDGPFNIGDSPFWLGVVGLFAEAVEARTSYQHRKRQWIWMSKIAEFVGACVAMPAQTFCKIYKNGPLLDYIISSRRTIIVPHTECNVISLLPQWYYAGIQPQ